MVMGRSSMTKQVEGQLRGAKKEKKKEKKEYIVKKSNKRILSLGHLLFRPRVVQSKKLYNRKRLKHDDKTMC